VRNGGWLTAGNGDSPDLVVIGHILEEVIRFPDHDIGPVLGGPAAYASVAASRLGTETGLVTFVSTSVPDFVIKPLEQAGVRLDGIRQSRVTRRTILVYDDDGTKTVTYLSTPPSITTRGVRPAYWNAHAFLICPMDFEVGDDVLRRAKRSGGVVMIDLGGYGGTVSTRHPVDDAGVMCRVQQAVEGVDIVKASLEDCRFLFGPTVTPVACVEQLSQWGGRVAVVTMGQGGILILAKGDTQVRAVEAFPVDPVDVTGAGDVFCGAFVTEFLRTGSAIESGTYGCAAAGLAIRSTGGVTVGRMPSDAMVRALMSGDP
jgi:sugar/nucleoside kinase (ribokinase family)